MLIKVAYAGRPLRISGLITVKKIHYILIKFEKNICF